MLQRTAVSLASSYYRTIEACDFFKYSLMASYNLLSFQTVTAFIPARAPEKIRHLPLIKWHSRKTFSTLQCYSGSLACPNKTPHKGSHYDHTLLSYVLSTIFLGSSDNLGTVKGSR